MRIGIDVRTVLSNRRGFRRLRGLLRAFFDMPAEHEFIFFASPDDQLDSWQLPSHVRWEEPARRLRLLHRQRVGAIGRRLFRDIHAFHFPTAEVWYSKYAPTVVTLHDLSPLHCADRFFQSEEQVCRYRKHLERIVAIADRIATVSEYSRQDLINTLGIDGGRVRVIYQGFEDVAAASAGSRPEVFADLELPGPYLFYCGGLDVRKNVEGLIRGFAHYRREFKGDRILVIAGESDPKQPRFYPDLRACAKAEGVGESVLFPGWVEDNVLGAYYRQADAFVFPSLFEGFGYTPLEAMAARIPVICSKAASLPETVGEAALLVDAMDPSSLGRAMAEVVEDGRLRQTLVQKGLENLRRFQWKTTAREFVALYGEVAREAGRLGKDCRE